MFLRYLNLWLILLVLCFMPIMAYSLQINELMSRNVSYKMYQLNNEYDFAGWVELYNDDKDSVDLKGYQFMDNEDHLWVCDTSIVMIPGTYAIVWFSGRGVADHANFKLNAEGGNLYLLDAKGNIVDQLVYPKGIRNRSYGCLDEINKSDFTAFNTPSFGSSNACSSMYAEVSTPLLSHNAGFYTSPIDLEIYADSPCLVYYTNDGSEPFVSDSLLYKGVVHIDKNCVIKAIAVNQTANQCGDDCYLTSSPVSSTFFIDERDIRIPVLSISIDERFLFDDTLGIYVKGVKRYPSLFKSRSDANYWGEECRPMNIELFDTLGVCRINQEVLTEIYGNYSRSYDTKSLKLSPSKICGNNKLDYTLFPSKPYMKIKDVVLRSSGQDYGKSYMRDGFMHSLVHGAMDLDVQAYQPVSVFLNGRYWGLRNIRELHNKDYLYSNYGLDDTDICPRQISETSLYQKLKKMDLQSGSAAELMDTLYDINEITNYLVSQVYFANTDWGQNNVKFWSRSAKGMWRIVLYDTDEGFSNSGDKKDSTTIHYIYKNSAFRIMLSNDSVKNVLLTKFIVHLATTFSPNRVVHILDSMVANIKDEALYNSQYRKENGLSVSSWNSQIEKMRDFAEKRPTNVFKHLKNYYSLGDTSSIRMQSDQHGTEFYLNGERIVTHDFHSYCFDDFALTLTCCPPDGFLFDHWEVTSGDSVYVSDEEDLQTVFHGPTAYRAVLKKDEQSSSLPKLYLNEICITNKMYVDEYRESDDWIEIYNAGSSPVDLGGMYLSDGKNNLQKFRIPDDNPAQTTVMGKSYIVFWADEQTEQGPLHTNFSLSASKQEKVSLSMRKDDEDFVILDSVTYELHEKGETFARFSYDDFGSWTKTKWPTFSADNRLLGYERTTEENKAEETTSLEISSFSVNVSVCPNPVIDMTWISIPWKSATYSLYSNGVLCMMGALKNNQPLNMYSLPSGFYLLSIEDDKSHTKEYVKIIKR